MSLSVYKERTAQQPSFVCIRMSVYYVMVSGVKMGLGVHRNDKRKGPFEDFFVLNNKAFKHTLITTEDRLKFISNLKKCLGMMRSGLSDRDVGWC